MSNLTKFDVVSSMFSQDSAESCVFVVRSAGRLLEKKLGQPETVALIQGTLSQITSLTMFLGPTIEEGTEYSEFIITLIVFNVKYYY